MTKYTRASEVARKILAVVRTTPRHEWWRAIRDLLDDEFHDVKRQTEADRSFHDDV